MKKLILIFFILLFACNTPPPSFEGTWLGMAFEMDKDVFVPFPRIMIAKKDGSFYAHLLGEVDTSKTKWKETEDGLQIDTSIFSADQFLIDKQQLTFNGPFKGFYKRLTNPLAFNVENIKQLLDSSCWESKFDQVCFDSSGDLLIRSNNQNLSGKACWSILQDEGFTFLIKKGNHQDCNDFQRFPELLTRLSDDQFTIERWEANKWQEITYNRMKADQFKNFVNDFQLCNPYLYRNNPAHRYYYKNTFYKGGIYKLNKLLSEFYKAPKNSDESGLIKVEFIVNCQGKTGHFSLLELDDNYAVKKFSADISEQLLAFTKGLTDWNPGVNQKGQPIDTYRFLTYRIENGKVVELFP